MNSGTRVVNISKSNLQSWIASGISSFGPGLTGREYIDESSICISDIMNSTEDVIPVEFKYTTEVEVKATSIENG